MVLEKIQKENDIKKLTPEELELLKDEIRQFLIESISVTVIWHQTSELWSLPWRCICALICRRIR